jgi:hypothetical protein
VPSDERLPLRLVPIRQLIEAERRRGSTEKAQTVPNRVALNAGDAHHTKGVAVISEIIIIRLVIVWA